MIQPTLLDTGVGVILICFACCKARLAFLTGFISRRWGYFNRLISTKPVNQLINPAKGYALLTLLIYSNGVRSTTSKLPICNGASSACGIQKKGLRHTTNSASKGPNLLTIDNLRPPKDPLNASTFSKYKFEVQI